MEELQIEIGMILQDCNTQIRYRIIFVREGTIILCRMDCSKLEIIPYSLQEVKGLLLSNDWNITPPDGSCVVDYESFSGKLRETFETKRAIVHQVAHRFGPTYLGLFSEKARPQIAEICENIGISRATFWKSVRLYLQGGLDTNALLDRRWTHAKNNFEYTAKTGRPAQYGAASTLIITPEIKSQFDDGIENYQSGRSQSLRSAYNYVMMKYYSVENDTEQGIAISLLPITERPSFRQFSYYVHNTLTKKDMDIIKTSRREYRNDKRLLLSDSLNGVFGPGDCVEIDEHEADISLVSSVNHKDVIGRPILYFMIDVYTRAIVAFSVSLENNSTLGLTNCLLNLSDDKAKLCQCYGIEIAEDAWIPSFLPNRIRCDRGAEYRGKRAEQIFHDLGITRELVPPATGSLKGIVEHMFRQLELDINPYIEGTGQIQKRYDSKHHQQATLDINDFTAMVVTLVNKHNHSYMEQYPRTKDMYAKEIAPIPTELWRYGVEKYGSPRPISNKAQYLYALMEPIPAKISRAGLTWKGLSYINLSDPYFRACMESAGRKKVDFDARIDPRDIGFLYYLQKGELKQALLNPNKTGNADFTGMTKKEYEEFYKRRKFQDKSGRELNLHADAATSSVYCEIVAAAKDSRPDTVNIQNMRESRKAERYLINTQNAIQGRLPAAAQLPSPPEKVPFSTHSYYFDIDSCDPAVPDFWETADFAAKQEEKKRQQSLQNGELP